jgi:hypothetical protein
VVRKLSIFAERLNVCCCCCDHLVRGMAWHGTGGCAQFLLTRVRTREDSLEARGDSPITSLAANDLHQQSLRFANDASPRRRVTWPVLLTLRLDQWISSGQPTGARLEPSSGRARRAGGAAGGWWWAGCPGFLTTFPREVIGPALSESSVDQIVLSSAAAVGF